MYETTLIYDESIVRRAVWCYWRRSLGAGYWGALVLVLASFVVLQLQGPNDWVVIALAVTLAVALGFAALLYFVHHRASMARFRRLSPPSARFVADAETLAFSSSVGEVKLQWSVVKELWKFNDLWLILYDRSGFNVLPLSCMPDAMRDFVEERIRATGGRVR